MRYIAIFLLLANLGYFAWTQYGAEPPISIPTRESRPLLNSGLTLVSEYQAQLAAMPAVKCFTVGAFSSNDEAASFMNSLGEMPEDARLSLSGEPLSSQYRVFLPPASSRGIATITLDALSEALAAAEVEIETYLITRGPLENGIALGVFPGRLAAEQVQALVQGLDYAPEIEEIPRSTGEIQVQLQMLEQDVLENPAWLEMTAFRPDLSITENLCETIAQGTQFP